MTGLTTAYIETLESRAIDIEWADRLGLETTRRAGTDVLAFPFLRNGEVVRRKYWNPSAPDGQPRWNADKGGLRIAFNEDCLRDDSLTGQPLLITEGEFDCVAALQAGHLRSISVPDGAPPPGRREESDLRDGSKYAWLTDPEWGIGRSLLGKDRCPEIILATDGDTNGAALFQDLTVLLGRYRCKYVTYPRLRAPGTNPSHDRLRELWGRDRCKDLNDVLIAYGERGVREVISRAQFVKVSGVYRMSELPPLPDNVVLWPHGGDGDDDHRLDAMAERVGFRLGDLSVWTGIPGHGKTTAANDAFCGIAKRYGVRVGWASFEQEPQRDHRRNLRTWFAGELERNLLQYRQDLLAEADRWIDDAHVFLVPSEDEDATLAWLFEKMEAAAQQHGVKVFVIDPWNELEHEQAYRESESQYIGRVLRRLKRFAKAFQVHIAIIAHPTKAVKGEDGAYRMPTLYDISGSANWFNKCDLGIIVHRVADDPLLGNTVIRIAKVKYHGVIGKPGELRAAFVPSTNKYSITNSED